MIVIELDIDLTKATEEEIEAKIKDAIETLKDRREAKIAASPDLKIYCGLIRKKTNDVESAFRFGRIMCQPNC